MFKIWIDEIDLLILKEVLKLGERANGNKIYTKTPLSYSTISSRIRKLIRYGLLVESGSKSGRRVMITKKGMNLLKIFQ